jgi:hypothetical protein
MQGAYSKCGQTLCTNGGGVLFGSVMKIRHYEVRVDGKTCCKAYNELIAKICASAIADAVGKEVELTYIAYQDENNN